MPSISLAAFAPILYSPLLQLAWLTKFRIATKRILSFQAFTACRRRLLAMSCAALIMDRYWLLPSWWFIGISSPSPPPALRPPWASFTPFSASLSIIWLSFGRDWLLPLTRYRDDIVRSPTIDMILTARYKLQMAISGHISGIWSIGKFRFKKLRPRYFWFSCLAMILFWRRYFFHYPLTFRAPPKFYYAMSKNW